MIELWHDRQVKRFILKALSVDKNVFKSHNDPTNSLLLINGIKNFLRLGCAK